MFAVFPSIHLLIHHVFPLIESLVICSAVRRKHVVLPTVFTTNLSLPHQADYPTLAAYTHRPSLPTQAYIHWPGSPCTAISSYCPTRHPQNHPRQWLLSPTHVTRKCLTETLQMGRSGRPTRYRHPAATPASRLIQQAAPTIEAVHAESTTTTPSTKGGQTRKIHPK